MNEVVGAQVDSKRKLMQGFPTFNHRHCGLALLLAAFALLPGPAALACSPIKSIGILFDRNSAHVSAEQVFKLANWTAELRARNPNREAVFMSTQADFGERDAGVLGWERARNVAKDPQGGFAF